MTVHEVLDRTQPANLIGNVWTTSSAPAQERRNPADQSEVVGIIAETTASELDQAVATAMAALPAWSAVPAPVRGDILARWSVLIGENASDLAHLMTREMGKPLAESRAELGRARAELDYMAAEGTRLCGKTVPSRSPGQLVYTVRGPIGVVAAVTPWNFPAVAPVRKLGPALVAGNTVVLKPAAESALTALALGTLLREAGLPDGVLSVVTGSGAGVGASLVDDPRVNGVSFTGSTAVGRQIAESVARRLGKVQLELGGKNAVYVHSAADLKPVADHITSAAIQASGQRCTAISRVIVQEEVADELVALLVDAYSSYVVGPGTAPDTVVGPLVNQAQYDRVTNYVATGLGEGARRATPLREVPAGLYFPPTVLDGVTPDMVVAREEIFGPVLCVTRVHGPDEALALVNDSVYGLAAVVFTEDLGVAMRFSREAEAGMVHVNHGTISQPHVPFGGVKESGAGDFSIGYTGTDFFTQAKTVYLAEAVS
jgi:aldehyde dehydrogenase (NAD+)